MSMCQHYLVITVLTIGLFTSCQPPTTNETPANLAQAQEIYAEAIEIHDEVMPRMGELMQLRRSIETRIDSLNQLDSAVYADTVQYMQFVVRNLQYADQGMMQWMRNVKKVPSVQEVESDYHNEMQVETADTTNIVQVQKSQKTAIEQVKKQMESSIEEAQSLLNND